MAAVPFYVLIQFIEACGKYLLDLHYPNNSVFKYMMSGSSRGLHLMADVSEIDRLVLIDDFLTKDYLCKPYLTELLSDKEIKRQLNSMFPQLLIAFRQKLRCGSVNYINVNDVESVGKTIKFRAHKSVLSDVNLLLCIKK